MTLTEQLTVTHVYAIGLAFAGLFHADELSAGQSDTTAAARSLEGIEISTERADGSESTLDAGIMVGVNKAIATIVDDGQPAAGGWLAVGSARFRLQADYWYKHIEDDFAGNVGLTLVDSNTSVTSHQLDLAVVTRFRRWTKLVPQAIVGTGYVRTASSGCETTETPGYVERRVTCHAKKNHHFAVLLGAGMDVSFTGRIFLRMQSRWYVMRGARLPLPVLAVGVGIRVH